MPRNARLDIPGYPRHLCIRAVNGMPCFLSDLDRNVFMAYLRDAMEGEAFDLHAFVLMSNHAHLLATGHETGAVARVMHSLGLRYARYFNRFSDRRGPVFQGRYWSSIIENGSYFLEAMRYIELNPVRAGLVDHPASHAWSSHAHNAGIRPRSEIVFHEEYLGLAATPDTRARAWAGFVAMGMRPDDLARIRKRFTRNHPYGGGSFEKRFGTGIGDGSPEPSRRTVPEATSSRSRLP